MHTRGDGNNHTHTPTQEVSVTMSPPQELWLNNVFTAAQHWTLQFLQQADHS